MNYDIGHEQMLHILCFYFGAGFPVDPGRSGDLNFIYPGLEITWNFQLFPGFVLLQF